MEPITYLSGLSTVICGYLWYDSLSLTSPPFISHLPPLPLPCFSPLPTHRFLYQGREVSYSSVLDRSVLARRQALYKTHGLDIERWAELQADARRLRREIGDIAQDYDQNWRRGVSEGEREGGGEGGKKGGEEAGGVDGSKGADDTRDGEKGSKADETKGEESSRSSAEGGEEGGAEQKAERTKNAKEEMEREVSEEVRGEVGGSVAEGKGIEDARDGGNSGSDAEREMRGEEISRKQDREDKRDGKGP